MNLNDYLYQLDHYDAWNYIIIGPLSFIAALSFIVLNIQFKESRRFPGNLLIIISMAELFLCVHWILSGIYTPYISGQSFDALSNFCTINSHVAIIAATLELTFQFSFLFSIIIQFQNTMKKIKFQSLFLIFPLVITIGVWYQSYSHNILGKNVFGTCSVNQAKNSGLMFIFVTGSYLTVVLITIYTLKKYKKLSENRITIRDDFYNFYLQYAVLTFFMYICSGSSFFIDQLIVKNLDGSESQEEIISQLRWFYISRLTNNVKIFIPFFTFLLRLNDPFLQKLIKKFYFKIKTNEDEMSLNISKLSDEEITEDDFIINNQIKQIRKGISRSLLKGISDYFQTIIHNINDIDDENVINLLTHEIDDDQNDSILEQQNNIQDDDNNQQKDINDEKFFKCKMQSMYTKKFQDIIKQGNFNEIFKSFLVQNNIQAIQNSGDSDGGAGGEFFLMTFDKRFFIKTITSDEEKVFENIISEYRDHHIEYPNTFIIKIIGYFVFDFDISDQSIKVIVFENVFKEKPSLIKRKFDMKGSTYSRQVLKDYSDIQQDSRIKNTLKDIDFDNIEQDIKLNEDTRKIVYKQFLNDVNFFQCNKIIDYSVLLGVIDINDELQESDLEILKKLEQQQKLFYSMDGSKAYMIGIIDFFQLYTWDKFMEKWTKRIMNMKIKLDTSSQPAGFYGKRFMDYINKILVKQLYIQRNYYFIKYPFKTQNFKILIIMSDITYQRIYIGEIQIVQNLGESLMQLDYIHQEQNSLQQHVQIIKQFQNIQHKNLLQTKNFKIKENNNLCDKSFKLTQYFPYYQQNLRNEFIQRQRSQQYFKTKQLLKLLYESIDVFAFLEKNQIPIKAFHPCQFFLKNDPNDNLQQISFFYNYNDPKDIKQGFFNSIVNDFEIYMTPEDFYNLQKQDLSKKRYDYQDDMFTLGLIFLELGTLTSIQPLFNHNSHSFNYQSLKLLQQQFNEQYQDSEFLQEILNALLLQDQQQRISAYQLKLNLPQWQEVKKHFHQSSVLQNQYSQQNQQNETQWVFNEELQGYEMKSIIKQSNLVQNISNDQKQMKIFDMNMISQTPKSKMDFSQNQTSNISNNQQFYEDQFLKAFQNTQSQINTQNNLKNIELNPSDNFPKFDISTNQNNLKLSGQLFHPQTQSNQQNLFQSQINQQNNDYENEEYIKTKINNEKGFYEKSFTQIPIILMPNKFQKQNVQIENFIPKTQKIQIPQLNLNKIKENNLPNNTIDTQNQKIQQFNISEKIQTNQQIQKKDFSHQLNFDPIENFEQNTTIQKQQIDKNKIEFSNTYQNKTSSQFNPQIQQPHQPLYYNPSNTNFHNKEVQVDLKKDVSPRSLQSMNNYFSKPKKNQKEKIDYDSFFNSQKFSTKFIKTNEIQQQEIPLLKISQFNQNQNFQTIKNINNDSQTKQQPKIIQQNNTIKKQHSKQNKFAQIAEQYLEEEEEMFQSVSQYEQNNFQNKQNSYNKNQKNEFNNIQQQIIQQNIPQINSQKHRIQEPKQALSQNIEYERSQNMLFNESQDASIYDNLLLQKIQELESNTSKLNFTQNNDLNSIDNYSNFQRMSYNQQGTNNLNRVYSQQKLNSFQNHQILQSNPQINTDDEIRQLIFQYKNMNQLIIQKQLKLSQIKINKNQNFQPQFFQNILYLNQWFIKLQILSRFYIYDDSLHHLQ